MFYKYYKKRSYRGFRHTCIENCANGVKRACSRDVRLRHASSGCKRLDTALPKVHDLPRSPLAQGWCAGKATRWHSGTRYDVSGDLSDIDNWQVSISADIIQTTHDLCPTPCVRSIPSIFILNCQYNCRLRRSLKTLLWTVFIII